MSFRDLNQLMPASGLVSTGRVKPTGMNRTEQAYAQELELRRTAGDIQWWAYEAVKFRLADKTFYTPDFAVMLADGQIEIHEVKGHWEEDARVKIKVAAETFPFRFIAVRVRPRKEGGGWQIEAFE